MKLRRVFALVPDCHVAGWRYGLVWRRHFYEGIQSAGIDMILPQGVNFDWARPVQSACEDGQAEKQATSLELSRQIDRAMEAGLDAVVSCCFSHDLELEILDRVRSAGVPWINFFCDSSYAFHMVEALARRTSLNWFVEAAAETRYRSLGVPCVCAPYALNPRALPDASCSGAERALSFVGTARKNRVRTVTLLRLAGGRCSRVGVGLAGGSRAAPRRGLAPPKGPEERASFRGAKRSAWASG